VNGFATCLFCGKLKVQRLRFVKKRMKSKSGKAKAVNRNHPAFNKNAKPFYDIIMKGLKGEVEGEHFWDAVAENAVFEFLYDIPGFTNKIKGRAAYMDWFGGYTNILKSADNLRVHKTTQPNVIILEYFGICRPRQGAQYRESLRQPLLFHHHH
jgi:hypothetical protein